MSLLSRLFGGKSSEASVEASSSTYEGYTITPTPMREGNQYRLSARIEKEIGGETKTHILVRADVLESAEAAGDAAVRKAKQIIDEQGDRIFC